MPKNYNMILVDVKSLFTNVLLDETRRIILRKIFGKGKIEASIPRKAMKALLLLCTKNINFIFNEDIYIQLGGVAICAHN